MASDGSLERSLSLTLASPLGPLTLLEAEGAIAELRWAAGPAHAETPLLTEAARQLEAYFAGRLRQFDLDLAACGSDYERSVWQAMRRIPYGETLSYGALAAEAGGSAREVGQACGSNPIPIIVPCHRVLAAGRDWGGYSGRGGLATKRFLLELEGAAPAWQLSLF